VERENESDLELGLKGLFGLVKGVNPLLEPGDLDVHHPDTPHGPSVLVKGRWGARS